MCKCENAIKIVPSDVIQVHPVLGVTKLVENSVIKLEVSSMSSYFANYMPDMRNGGVVSAEHQQHHYGQVPQGGGAVQTDPTACAGDPSVVGLRQGIPPHHYGGPPAAGQPPQGMPYPRFPPYDRMDIRNAGYYNAQQMDGSQGEISILKYEKIISHSHKSLVQVDILTF